MFFKSLSIRLKALTLIWLFAAACSISLTLLLSWRLEGGAAAINDVGSLRMQTYRLLSSPHSEYTSKINQFTQTLTNLEHGDPNRPLFLPNDANVNRKMCEVVQQWHNEIAPRFQAAQNPNSQQINHFIHNINNLAKTIETVNTDYIKWLRMFQLLLLMMVIVSAFITVWLLSRWVLRPLNALQNGVQAVHDGHFGQQVAVEDSAEFAQVDKGFNQMSNRLQQLYGHLEQEVAEKTRDLTEKNHILETMYHVLHQLNNSQSAADAAQQFLQEIMQNVAADVGSIRLIDAHRGRMDLMTHIGLPESLQHAEACRQFHSEPKNEWQPIVFHDKNQPIMSDEKFNTACCQAGFSHLSVFPIQSKGVEIGLLTLYFQAAKPDYLPRELIENLCYQLGSALSHIRLAGENRQLAVLQERNLLAQGLHDSIAQTLTFLNLQVQMLESALAANEPEQVQENLTFIRDGVQECYEDVRELLLNFRTKITRKEFPEAVQTLTQRFEQQTHIPVEMDWRGNGPSLSAEQELQFIFILQESLSNIRKHSQAQSVQIIFENQDDVMMTIRDDGRGFDSKRLANLSGSHVGLNIMRERAKRIHAHLAIQSVPNEFTEIKLTLPETERILE